MPKNWSYRGAVRTFCVTRRPCCLAPFGIVGCPSLTQGRDRFIGPSIKVNISIDSGLRSSVETLPPQSNSLRTSENTLVSRSMPEDSRRQTWRREDHDATRKSGNSQSQRRTRSWQFRWSNDLFVHFRTLLGIGSGRCPTVLEIGSGDSSASRTTSSVRLSRSRQNQV
jgi:hypothetical protein